MAVTRIYDGILIAYTDDEERRLRAILDNPKRVKYPNNSKTPCPFDRMLIDIQKYIGDDTGRIA